MLSTTLPKGASEHVLAGVKEQGSLYSRSGKPVKSVASFFKVTLECGSASVSAKGPVLDNVFTQAVTKLLEENERVKHIHVLIKFRWKGCPHWRSLPCEFGNTLNTVKGKIKFHYSCNCGCS